MKKRRLTLACCILTTAAVTAALVPVAQDRLSTITLTGCDVGVVPGTEALVVWSDVDHPEPFDDEKEYGVRFLVWVPDNVALKAGGFNGEDAAYLSDDAMNEVTLLYTPKDRDLKLVIKNASGTVLYDNEVPEEDYSGTFDYLAPANTPYMTEVRSHALNITRTRVWMDSFGLLAAFTIEG